MAYTRYSYAVARKKLDKWASRENCDFFWDTSLKIWTVTENLGQIVTLPAKLLH